MSDHSDLKKIAESAVGFSDVSLAPDVILDLIAEVEALRKDQERINFIEKEWFYAAGVNRQEFCFNETWDTPGQDLREAIDLASAKEQQP